MKLPFHQALEKIEACPEQKWMANSTQQARNVDGSARYRSRSVTRGSRSAGGRHGGFALDVDSRRLAAALQGLQ